MKTLDGAIAVVVIAVFGSGAHLAVADDALPAGGPAASATSEPAPESASEPVPGAPVISTDGPPATTSAAMESVRYSTWTLVADGASVALVIGGGIVGGFVGVVHDAGDDFQQPGTARKVQRPDSKLFQ